MVLVAEKDEVAAEELLPTVAEGTAHRARPRTADQQRLVDEHVALVDFAFAHADLRLVALLLDDTVLWTEDLERWLGVSANRMFQFYTAGREFAAAGESMHPSGVPLPDAMGGKRGFKVIRGIMKGRFLLWAWNAGRLDWNPFTGEFIRVETDTTAEQIAKARLALTRDDLDLPEHYRQVLAARVSNPDLSLAAVAESINMGKSKYTGLLRRALEAADRP